jgi:hypothetical protein
LQKRKVGLHFTPLSVRLCIPKVSHQKEPVMSTSWFFATTPIPQRPQVAPVRKRPAERAGRRWWQRLAERYVAWSERSEQRHVPMQMHY